MLPSCSDFWEDEDPVVKKEILMDSEPTNHHEVHCPHLPNTKYEWWFVYMTEKKSNRLQSMIVPCKTLDVEKTVELRFSAPPQKGTYYFVLNVRSDSYLNSDYVQEVKVVVHALLSTTYVLICFRYKSRLLESLFRLNTRIPTMR